ncbi:MAG: DUF2007 domain-containing protein [Candidatus Eisenbacteria bacterium]|nr:DUF2007 domain-containing protein [Candidatus Eisenbacteria bacterium]
MTHDDDLVVIKIFPNDVLAQVAASFLEANGIQAVVSTDDAGGAYPFLQGYSGVRLMVRKSDEDIARELLEQVGESEAEP